MVLVKGKGELGRVSHPVSNGRLPFWNAYSKISQSFPGFDAIVTKI